jgi:hypothetical protein
MAQPQSRRRPRKHVVRHSDGSLFDTLQGRAITPEELADHLRNGGLFEARREDSGADCTFDVLHRVLEAGSPRTLMPRSGGRSSPN